MRRLLLEYTVFVLSILGSLASIYSVSKFIELSDQGKVAIFFLGTYSVVFFIYALLLKRRMLKSERYSLIFGVLNTGFSDLHEIQRKEHSSLNDITRACQDLCTCLSQAFSLLTDSVCSCCIKIILSNAGNTHVYTLARDKSSSTKRHSGIKDIKSNQLHYIADNSDFEYIYHNSKQPQIHYFNNDLPSDLGYKNSRLKQFHNYPPKPSKIALLDWIRKRREWPLEYKSTIVVPIAPYAVRTGFVLGGYLCVDSDKAKVFNQQIDVEILRGVADGLFDKIERYRLLHKIEAKLINENNVDTVMANHQRNGGRRKHGKKK